MKYMRSQKKGKERQKIRRSNRIEYNDMIKNNNSIFVNLLFDGHLMSNNTISRQNLHSLNLILTFKHFFV